MVNKIKIEYEDNNQLLTSRLSKSQRERCFLITGCYHEGRPWVASPEVQAPPLTLMLEWTFVARIIILITQMLLGEVNVTNPVERGSWSILGNLLVSTSHRFPLRILVSVTKS